MTQGQPHLPTPKVVDSHTLEELARAPHRAHFAQLGQRRPRSRVWHTLTSPIRLAFRTAIWPFRRLLRAWLD